MADKISLTLYNISIWERLLNDWVNIDTIRSIDDFNFWDIVDWYNQSAITYWWIKDKISLKMFSKWWNDGPIYQNDFLKWLSNELPLLENKRASFILFILYNWERYLEENNTIKTDKKLYAICWWSWWADISWYINNQFGFDVISRVLPAEAKDKELIRYLENKNIIWNVDYQSRSFRKLYSIWYDNSYWSIYTDMVLSFDESLLEKIWINELSSVNISNNVWVAITSWFYIKKTISFDQLQEIIEKISLLYYETPNFSFNKLEMVKVKDVKKILRSKFLEKIQEDLFNACNCQIFSIWVQDTQSYSDDLKIMFWRDEYPIENQSDNFSLNILKKVIEIYMEKGNISDIEHFLSNLKLKWEYKNYWNILRLLETEFEYDDNTFFYFLWNYYKVKNTLKTRINEDFKILYEWTTFLNTHILLDETWAPWEREDLYNIKYASKDNYYIFDKITPEWVEFCDILNVWENWEISIFHIKDWFWQSIRDLVYQVENSISLLHDQVLTSDSEWYFLKLYESKLRNCVNDNFKSAFPNLESFLNLFRDWKKINIYLWIRYRDNWGDYLRIKSLVPKIAILDLQKKINNTYSMENFSIVKL